MISGVEVSGSVEVEFGSGTEGVSDGSGEVVGLGTMGGERICEILLVDDVVGLLSGDGGFCDLVLFEWDRSWLIVEVGSVG